VGAVAPATLVGLLSLLGLLPACSGGGSVGDDDAADVATPLDGYSIDYDVTVSLPSGAESSRRLVRVSRPFAGLDITVPEGSTAPAGGALSDGNRLYTVHPGRLLDAGVAIPGPPPGDYRFTAVLGDLVRLGLLVPQGSAVVAGRGCDVYRTGAPLGDPLRAPQVGEFADWCIDPEGLLLSERWTLDGRPLRTTVATSVIARRPTTPIAPDGSLPVEPNPALTARAEALDVERRPEVGDASYWVASPAPGSWQLTRRLRVVTTSTLGGAPQIDDLAYVDVYRRGVDVVVVAHRDRAFGAVVATGLEQREAGALGEMDVLLSPRGAELAVAREQWVISVQGTTSVADLVEFASALRPLSGP